MVGAKQSRRKSGHCEDLDPEIMRTIPMEEPTDNQVEISFEIFRGSEEDLTSGEEMPAPGSDKAMGECEVLRQDSSKEEHRSLSYAWMRRIFR